MQRVQNKHEMIIIPIIGAQPALDKLDCIVILWKTVNKLKKMYSLFPWKVILSKLKSQSFFLGGQKLLMTHGCNAEDCSFYISCKETLGSKFVSDLHQHGFRFPW